MNVNHELAHSYIAALSCTKEGAELVQALEAVRYYHSEGRIAQLGGGSMLVTAVDAYDDGDLCIPLLSAVRCRAASTLSPRWQSQHLWIRSICRVSPKTSGHTRRQLKLMRSAETHHGISRRSSCQVTSRTAQRYMA